MELIMNSFYRDYWSTAPSGAYKRPQAGFQTVWVQSHLQQEQARTEALRAQHIESTATF